MDAVSDMLKIIICSVLQRDFDDLALKVAESPTTKQICESFSRISTPLHHPKQLSEQSVTLTMREKKRMTKIGPPVPEIWSKTFKNGPFSGVCETVSHVFREVLAQKTLSRQLLTIAFR